MTLKNIYILVFFITIVCMSACTKRYMKGTIYVGNGGGFTGAWKEYQWHTDGKLFLKLPAQTEPMLLKIMDSTTTRKVFKRYYKLKLDSDNLDAPGNVYFYIGRREGKFRNHKVTFGNPEINPNSELKKYYDDLMEEINTTK